MLAPELREKIVKALRGQNGFGTWYDYYDEDHDEYEFFGAAIVNWKIFIMTLLFLKLEKDGEIPAFSDQIIDEDAYRYGPLSTGDTDVDDEPFCRLILKCMTKAGFEFPTQYNFMTSDSSWSRYQTVYAPPAGTDYSVHTDELKDVDLKLILNALDSYNSEWAEEEEFSLEAVRACQFLKRAYLNETGEESEYLPDLVTMDEEDFELESDSMEEKLKTIWSDLEAPFGFYCCYHPKWQKVRALYYRETKRANKAGEDPKYPFDLEAYKSLDEEVERICNSRIPTGSSVYFYAGELMDAEIDGAPVEIQMVPDVNTVPDEGYGRCIYLVNPLVYVTPEIPLTFMKVKEDIDKFYASVFPGEEEQ